MNGVSGVWVAVLVLLAALVVAGAFWLGRESGRSPAELERQAQIKCSQDQLGFTYERCVRVVLKRLQEPNR